MSSIPSLSPSGDLGSGYYRYSPIHRAGDETNDKDPFKILPFNRRIRATKDVVLEWCNSKERLQPWVWPIHNSVIVPTKDLCGHRKTHEFRFPCCFCATADPSPTAFTESVVIIPSTGNLKGKVVATCALKACKYWVNLDAIFARTSSSDFTVKEFPLKTMRDVSPAIATFDLDDLEFRSSSPSQAGSLRLDWFDNDSRKYATPMKSLKRMRYDISSAPESSQAPRKRRRTEYHDSTPPKGSSNNAGSYLYTRSPPPAAEATVFSLLMALDDNGLSMREFQSLFVVCRLCNDWVGTPSSLEKHYCPRHRFPAPHNAGEVIDLTGED